MLCNMQQAPGFRDQRATSAVSSLPDFGPSQCYSAARRPYSHFYVWPLCLMAINYLRVHSSYEGYAGGTLSEAFHLGHFPT